MLKKELSDKKCPLISDKEAEKFLKNTPENEKWLWQAINHKASEYKIRVPDNIMAASKFLPEYLAGNISEKKAEKFPLYAMSMLKNRYEWTFKSNLSIYEQLEKEAGIVQKAWNFIMEIAEKSPVFLILNETTPTDYMTARLPENVSIFKNHTDFSSISVVVYKGLKISSSEHRDDLYASYEGKSLIKALKIAEKLKRTPVITDFSRRRFPRAFMRIAKFAKKTGMGINPLGKVLDLKSDGIPYAKSPRGFLPFKGHPEIMLFDPWPVSDPEIITGLSYDEKKAFCKSPRTKPWQDDRIGARKEMEADDNGHYKIVSKPWVVPVLGGWARTDEVFKAHIASFIRFKK